MTSTIDHPGSFDALEKARPGEPVFVLLGRDPAAPGTVTEWCRIRRNIAIRKHGHSTAESDVKLLNAEIMQCANAESIAEQMHEYRSNQTPDDSGVRASYQEVVKSEQELREAERRDRISSLCRNLREAAYHLCEATEGLADMALLNDATQRDVTMMLARINGLSDEFQPKRPGYADEPALPLDGAPE